MMANANEMICHSTVIVFVIKILPSTRKRNGTERSEKTTSAQEPGAPAVQTVIIASESPLRVLTRFIVLPLGVQGAVRLASPSTRNGTCLPLALMARTGTQIRGLVVTVASESNEYTPPF